MSKDYYQLNIIEEVNRELIKAIRILDNLDHNFTHFDDVGQYKQIIDSCKRILLVISEELVQTVAKKEIGG